MGRVNPELETPASPRSSPPASQTLHQTSPLTHPMPSQDPPAPFNLPHLFSRAPEFPEHPTFSSKPLQDSPTSPWTALLSPHLPFHPHAPSQPPQTPGPPVPSPALLQSTVKWFLWPRRAAVSPGPRATTCPASDGALVTPPKAGGPRDPALTTGSTITVEVSCRLCPPDSRGPGEYRGDTVSPHHGDTPITMLGGHKDIFRGQPLLPLGPPPCHPEAPAPHQDSSSPP